MANESMEPFVLDFPNGQRVEDILKKAQNMANIRTIGDGLSLDEQTGELSASGGGGGGGTDNYNLLTNKPKVNGIELKGNKSLVDLGILFGSSLIAEIDSSTYVVTITLKDQEGNILGEPQSLDLPLESVVVGGRYDNTTKKVVLTLQNGNTVEFSVADLVAGLQSELSSTNKLNPEFINYNSTHRAVSDSEKTTWNGKQDALTFDNTPTNGSSNPVKSGGVYAALNNKVDKVNGKGLSTNDFTDSDKEQITANTAGIGAVANSGAKNMLPITASSGTMNTATVTINSDSSITISGQPTLNGAYVISTGIEINVTANSYILSIGSEAGAVKMSISLRVKGTTQYVDLYQSESRIIPEGIYDRVHIYLYADTVYDTTIYPMIRQVEDDTYVPYGMTNTELTNKKANKTEVAAIANRGSKNMLPIKNHAVGDVTETNGFRFTLQADGGILIEDIGTHSGNGDYYLIGQWGNSTTLIDCSDGTYTATLEANDNTVSKVSLRIYKAGTSVLVNNVYANTSANFTGEVAFVFITAYTDAVIPSGGVVVYPMIRNAAIEDNTYVPYAPSNRELYEDKADKTETAAIANVGAKNVLNVTATSREVNGITFTVNDDNSVSINGTATARAQFQLAPSAPMPDLQGYILNGAVVNDSGAAIKFQYSASPWTSFANDSGNGAVIGNYNNANNIAVFIDVPNGATVDNLIFKPMIRNPNIEDDTYVPYGMTNAELTKAVEVNKAGIGAVANDSSKNRLKVTRSGVTVNGVTFTVNSDGTVTANGTATGLIRFDVSIEMRVEIGKTYILSGCPKLSGILVQYSDKTSYAKNDTGEGVDFNAVSTGTPTIIIRVNPNVVLNNVTFKPMICTPEEWAVSQEFVPYAPTNRELYETIDSIESELSVPIISSSTLLTDYANTLSRGYHTAFFTSASKPSDAPISDNCFVEIFVYSGSTAIMRVIPTGTAHYANNYVKTKVSGTWQSGWVVFAGTAQAGS